MKILAISPLRDDVSRLLEQAFAYAEELCPGGSNYSESALQLSRPNVHFIGAFERQKLLGIGAAKVLDHDLVYGEIKSLFVLPEARGEGVALQIMAALENHLRAKGIEVVRLETGVPHSAAIDLYLGLGYQKRGPYGQYQSDPVSVFMQKDLSRDLSGSESS